MIAGPATLTVLIGVVLLLAAGVILLKVGGRRQRRRQTQGSPDDPRLCRNCQHENPRTATYCARCGQELKIQD